MCIASPPARRHPQAVITEAQRAYVFRPMLRTLTTDSSIGGSEIVPQTDTEWNTTKVRKNLWRQATFFIYTQPN